MFEDAESVLERVLALVAKCPQPLQEKCFEVLLTAYAESSNHRELPRIPPLEDVSKQDNLRDGDRLIRVPEAIRPRFNSTAARLKVSPKALASLFDFTNDPFTYHALAVPGEARAEKVRNVALLIAAKSYLTLGSWSADWKEVRAACVDQNCYERSNFMRELTAKGNYFKSVSPETGISLGSTGVAAAESLLANVANSKAPDDAIE